MKETFSFYTTMAANAVTNQPLTPVECEMLNKFLQRENALAD